MARSRLALVLVCVLAVLVGTSVAQSSPPVSDSSLFQALYDSVLDLVAPASSQAGVPSQVLLFEMPGIPINRQQWDPTFWTASGYAGNQPDAVAAQFVDRLPYYYGPTFVDSGSQISVFWQNFIYQYIVPVVVNPEAEIKIAHLQPLLENGTLYSTYQTRFNDYVATEAQVDNLRDKCLSQSSAAVCSKRLVAYNELLRRKWFSLEVARRNIATAEASILALQVQDLKNTFADALEQYARYERVDVGAAGLGQTYQLTYLQPANFWRWWPQNVGSYDYTVSAGKTLTFTFSQPNATVAVPPSRGDYTFVGGVFTFVPNPSYTGADSVAFSYLNSKGAAAVSVFVFNIVGVEVSQADSSFISVSISSSSSSSTAQRTSSYGNTFTSSSSSSASSSTNPNWYWWWYSGASSSSSSSSSGSATASSSYASSASFSSASSSIAINFQLARVNIIRPWMDTSLLSYSPVAIRGVNKNGWSDGTISPAKNTNFQFKLLPVAFLVARNIQISNSQWQSSMASIATGLATASNSYQNGQSSRASIGPWFIGSSTSSDSSSSTGRDYQERSSFSAANSTSGSAATLSIQGPQVIGWLCTPVPAFPTATEDDVIAFENIQLAKYTRKQAALSTTYVPPTPPQAIVPKSP